MKNSLWPSLDPHATKVDYFLELKKHGKQYIVERHASDLLSLPSMVGIHIATLSMRLKIKVIFAVV